MSRVFTWVCAAPPMIQKGHAPHKTCIDGGERGGEGEGEGVKREKSDGVVPNLARILKEP